MTHLFALLIASLSCGCAPLGWSGRNVRLRTHCRPTESLAFVATRPSSSATLLHGQSSPMAGDASSPSLTDRGAAALRDGNLDEAASLLRAAIDEDGTGAHAAHLTLGATFRRMKDPAAAADSFRAAVALRPDDDEALFQLGGVLSEMGYVDDAADAFRRIVSNEEKSSTEEDEQRRPSRAKIALANVLLDGRGLKPEALAVFRASCDFAGGASPMAVPAGVVADSLGEHAAAVEYYRSAVEFDEGDKDAALHLYVGLRRRSISVAGWAKCAEEEAAALRSRLAPHVASSADYVLSSGVGMYPSLHYFTHDMIRLAVDSCTLEDGLVMEFGVYHGKTLRMIASHFADATVHGFDTFEGIPEDWHHTPKGSYSTRGALPRAQDNVGYHVGLFSDTLRKFLEDCEENERLPVRFMNIDCDLYSSTRDVLESLRDRIVPGTVIVFDEYVHNPNWKQDEYRAFQEAVEKHGWRYEYVGISLVTGQAVVRIV